MNPSFIVGDSIWYNSSFLFSSIYVVNNVTATLPDGPENIVTTQDNNQYYILQQNDQRTILVPIRCSTPPPSYTELFGPS